MKRMEKFLMLTGVVLAVGLALVGVWNDNVSMIGMKLSSPAFEDQGHIPAKYTCDGENIVPPLKIENAPEGTKSYVLIMEDPDVPKYVRDDGMWDHWIVFDIPADTTEIKEGKEPRGVHGITTKNELKYGGPCPPDAEHRYYFILHALDVESIGEQEGATKDAVRAAMKGHLLAKAELMGRYVRK
jgi:Raf kinase inhibitor-like YbhB/YbcL family protein